MGKITFSKNVDCEFNSRRPCDNNAARGRIDLKTIGRYKRKEWKLDSYMTETSNILIW